MVVDMAHIAGLVAAGVHPSPVPHAEFVTSTTHKTLRGPRGGLVLCREQYAKDLDRAVFPGVQGGPLMHIIAAKAVCFKEALEPSFAEYQRQIVANAARLASSLSSHGFRLVRLALARLGEPRVKQLERIGGHAAAALGLASPPPQPIWSDRN